MAVKSGEKQGSEKNFRKIFAKMFGVLKNVVFLQPLTTTEGH
jgi:hypothetical protein